jgi:hypothetical protein
MQEFRMAAVRRRSRWNRAALGKTARCGCFRCLILYDTAKIHRWTDGGQTALCAYCGCEAVLAGEGGGLSGPDLVAMHDHWFGADGAGMIPEALAAE